MYRSSHFVYRDAHYRIIIASPLFPGNYVRRHANNDFLQRKTLNLSLYSQFYLALSSENIYANDDMLIINECVLLFFPPL